MFAIIKFRNCLPINRSDCAATNSLLMNNIGKDISTEMNNLQHRPALDYISAHLRIGKFASNDNEEKVKRKMKL